MNMFGSKTLIGQRVGSTWMAETSHRSRVRTRSETCRPFAGCCRV